MNGSVRPQDAAALLHMLDEQAALLQEWLVADARVRQALLDRDMRLLAESVANQERILVDLDRREGLRRQLARRLVPGSAAEPTLRDVAERLGPELQAACREREERLRGLCAEVQARNAHSQTLLQQAAAYNQVLLDALLGRPGEAVTYTPSGEKASACGAAYDGTRAVDWHA